MGRGLMLSTRGLYAKDHTLFDNMVIPEGMDRDALLNKLLVDTAELEVCYPNTDMMKYSLGTWSQSHLHNWEIMYESLNKSNYDPFTDFDRNEEYEESFTTNGTGEENGTGSQRAFNEADLTDVSGSHSSAINNQTGTRSHRMRQYGNSALGTNQDIIEKEIKIRKLYNLYDIIIQQYKQDFTLLVY